MHPLDFWSRSGDILFLGGISSKSVLGVLAVEFGDPEHPRTSRLVHVVAEVLRKIAIDETRDDLWILDDPAAALLFEASGGQEEIAESDGDPFDWILCMLEFGRVHAPRKAFAPARRATERHENLKRVALDEHQRQAGERSEDSVRGEHIPTGALQIASLESIAVRPEERLKISVGATGW